MMNPRKLEELRRFNNLAKTRTFETYVRFLDILLSTTRSTKSEELKSLLRDKRFDEMVDCADGLASTVFRTPGEHRLNHQIAAVIRKYPFPKGTLNRDPEGKALETFLACEHRCKRVNQRFAAYTKVRSPFEPLLSRARDWIKYVLGPLDLASIWPHTAFGAGASLGIHGNATNLARKVLSKSWSVTPGAYYYARSVLKEDLHVVELLNHVAEHRPFFSVDPDLFNQRFGERAHMVDYNKIAFVPKTVSTHRTIAVEPLLNGYLQKGVDLYMRKRLQRVGIFLDDQSINQALARQGSAHWIDPNSYCTIDLSSASDSMSYGLCKYLLPEDWFYFLDSIRSRKYKLNGEVHPYHKFVSMGNGFCFPLETLVFAALVTAVEGSLGHKPDFSVYGDDIILRGRSFTGVKELLGICGFAVNTKKTFSQGPFRESCGADWFEGEDVRPVNLDYEFDSLENIFKFCNICRSKDSWRTIFYESLEFLESLIPRGLKFVSPYSGNADSCLTVPWDVFLASPFSRFERKTQSWSWVELVTTATPDNRVKRAAGYSIALTMGALRGAQASCPFTERYSSRTKIRRQSTGGGSATYVPSSSFLGGFSSEERSWWAERVLLATR